MDYLSIPQIARQIDISEATVRRYIGRFGDFFNDVNIKNRVKKYSGAVDVVTDINSWYNDKGYDRETIRIKLNEKYRPDTIPDTDTPDTTPNSTDRLGHLESKIDNLTQIMNHIFTLLSDSKNDIPVTTPDTMPNSTADTTSKNMIETEEKEPALQKDSVVERIPDYHGKTLTKKEKDDILLKVEALYPGRKNSQKRAEILNSAGIPCGKNGEPWTSKKFTDNIRFAKKRQEKV